MTQASLGNTILSIVQAPDLPFRSNRFALTLFLPMSPNISVHQWIFMTKTLNPRCIGHKGGLRRHKYLQSSMLPAEFSWWWCQDSWHSDCTGPGPACGHSTGGPLPPLDGESSDTAPPPPSPPKTPFKGQV